MPHGQPNDWRHWSVGTDIEIGLILASFAGNQRQDAETGGQ
jgi:hypothetical protein